MHFPSFPHDITPSVLNYHELPSLTLDFTTNGLPPMSCHCSLQHSLARITNLHLTHRTPAACHCRWLCHSVCVYIHASMYEGMCGCICVVCVYLSGNLCMYLLIYVLLYFCTRVLLYCSTICKCIQFCCWL